MKVYDAQSIRNVAFVGHSGAGKTQLISALLFDAGAVNRLGRVDDGTTVTDYDEEEIARKHTLSCSLACAEWNKHKINIIDTPGMGELPQRLTRRAAGRRRRGGGRRRGRGRRRSRPKRCGPRPTSSGCRGWSSSIGSTASAPASTARSTRCAPCSAAP